MKLHDLRTRTIESYSSSMRRVARYFDRCPDDLTPTELKDFFSTLATHSWVFNPFSYFGDSGVARFHSSAGYGLLIATWWLCNASLSTLMNDKRNRAAQLLLGLFLAIALGSRLAMNRLNEVVLDSLRASAPSVYAEARATAIEQGVGNGLGIVVGGLIFVAANKLQARFMTMMKSSG